MKKLLTFLIITFLSTMAYSADCVRDLKVGENNEGVAIGGGTCEIAGALTVEDGVCIIADEFRNALATDTDTIKAETSLTALTTSWVTRDLVQPVYPCNIQFTESSTGTITVTIVGYDAKYEAVTETISSFDYIYYSTNAFSVITSVAITNTSRTAWLASMGTGDRFGLSNDLTNSADVYKYLYSSADTYADSLTTGLTINTTYDTVKPHSAPDGTKDFKIFYKAKNR